MSKGRKAARSLKRRRPQLDLLPRVLIVCEGEATEPDYFEFFKREFRSVVSIVIDDNGGDPKTLVERALREKRSADNQARRTRDPNARYDEIWCVFDIDDHKRIGDAKQQAAAHSIAVAISNPCFELWLLLHFRDQQAHIDRHAAQAACKQHLPGFEKHVNPRDLMTNYDAAFQRATSLDRRHEADGEPSKNPSTGVYRITERIKSLGRDARINRLAQR